MARDFQVLILTNWPRYYEELKGIADGAEKDILDIIALNVRTEIVFGNFSDGCTSAYWKQGNVAYMGQNWDWVEDQLPNLIQLTIFQESLPTIKMVTEAGIIGKIGLNSEGVGVCFNAIRANGVDKTRIPVHLGLRMALESKTAELAVAKLEAIGMASSAYMVVADTKSAIGLEFTSTTFLNLPVNKHGFLVHSNHMLLCHENVYAPKWLEDSYTRLETMGQRILEKKELSRESFSSLFEDEYNFPCSISRAQEGASDFATLFNIVIDFTEGVAVVREGRPTGERTSPTMRLHLKNVK
ncbi:unnamed protein product [Penicillium manginii]